MYENNRPASMEGNRGRREVRDPRREVEYMDFIRVNEDHMACSNLPQSVIMRPVAERFKEYE